MHASRHSGTPHATYIAREFGVGVLKECTSRSASRLSNDAHGEIAKRSVHGTHGIAVEKWHWVLGIIVATNH